MRPQYYNPDDERYKFLALKKAELYLNESKSSYERAKLLYGKGLVSEERYEKIRVEYQHSEVTYQQALLNIIFDKPHITIEKAIKYQTKDGKKRVKITFHNTGSGSFDFEKLKTLEMKSVAAELNPRELTNVYVSILKNETIIGQPYEINIPVFNFDERRVVDFLLLQDMAYVSENVMLYENLNAYQNLGFFAELVGKKQIKFNEMNRIFSRVGLTENQCKRKLKTYSKGMRQKCGIAIAILKEARLIILDEPTSGLDPKSGKEFLDLLQEFRDEGKSIFMTTHDIFRARAIADNIGIMNDGKLLREIKRSEIETINLEEIYIEYIEQETKV